MGSPLALLALLLSLVALPACLTWSVEDDDDATDDDDDATPDPAVALQGDAILLVLAFDNVGQPATEPFLGALFNKGWVEPSLEEALVEASFGAVIPFAPPGSTEPRLIDTFGNYALDPVALDSVSIVTSSTSVLSDVGVVWLATDVGELPETGSRWLAEVAGAAPFAGSFEGPEYPAPADVVMQRQVGERVYVPAGLEVKLEVLDGGCPGCNDQVLFQSGDGGIPAIAYDLPGPLFELPPADLPWEIVESGFGNIVHYRARRETVTLSDGRKMLLVSGRSTSFDGTYLGPGVGFVSAVGPVPYDATAFDVQIEGGTFPADGTLFLLSGEEVGFEGSSPTTGTVYPPNGLGNTGVLDLVAMDPTGSAVGQGAVLIEPPVFACDLTEIEPNGLLSQAHFFNPGVVGCGSLDPAGDSDHYRFNAVAGSTYTFETWAGRLGYPTDTMLQLLTSSGQVLQQDDDGAGNLDSLLTWTATAGGPFFVRVLPYNSGGGPGNQYQLTTGVFP